MGISDSPLRDRVVFVEGSPRSGTTLLTALIAAHPEVAGITGEAHLFDRGVGDLFANHESGRYLTQFVSRERLVDTVRDLCDQILVSMRDATRPDARFVMDKTPTARSGPALALERKLEVYPDAHYLHIVRDRDEVVRSLMRAPWNPDPSEAASERWWREGVEAVRGVLGQLPRFRELGYEELVADPAGTTRGLYEWLGLEADAALLQRVEALAGERYSHFAPDEDDVAAEIDEAPARPGPRRRQGRVSRHLRDRLGVRRRTAIAVGLLDALRAGDAERLSELTIPGVRLSVHSGDGDVAAEGDAARRAMLDLGRRALAGRHVSESAPTVIGRDAAVILLGGVRPDGTRVDVSCAILIRGGRVVQVGMIFAGSPDGRAIGQA